MLRSFEVKILRPFFSPSSRVPSSRGDLLAALMFRGIEEKSFKPSLLPPQVKIGGNLGPNTP